MPLSEGSHWICTGTKRISIAEIDSSPADGTISVYCRPRNNADDGVSVRRSPASRLSSGGDDCLHVMITDGANTFYESIARKDIRHIVSEVDQQLDKVASILLYPDGEIFKVSYKRVRVQLLGGSHDSKNATSVKVSVRKTCMNNIVRPVWEGILNDICHYHYDDLPLFARNALPDVMNQSECSSGLSFSVMLGDTINKLHKEIDALRTKNKQLETNTLRWKSTSDKLSNQWENEKSELTDRFLTLFNEHKARHVETKKELDQLKTSRQRNEPISGTSNNRSSLGKSVEMPDHEDEHDVAEYDDEMVKRLAAGPSSTKRRSNAREPVASQKQKRQNSDSQTRGNLNPHNGIREYDNTQDAFSSDEEDDMKA